MITIRATLLALVTVSLADGFDMPKEYIYADHPSRRTLDLACDKYYFDWYQVLLGSRRINKGKDADPGMFPFMGAMGWRFKDSTRYAFHCGSTLINEKFLVTTGHCTYLPYVANKYTSPKPEVVALGIENIADVDTVTDKRQPKIAKILKIFKHPNYRPPKRYHDIALLETEDVIEFTKFIYPACVWTQDGDPAKNKGWIIGWQFGNTDITKTQTESLKYAKVNFLDGFACEEFAGRWGNRLWKDGIIDGQICAKGVEEDVDTCNGDSGGPLIYYERFDRNHFPSIVGITSFGGRCLFWEPTVYTRVSEYADWIVEVAFDSLNIDVK